MMFRTKSTMIVDLATAVVTSCTYCHDLKNHVRLPALLFSPQFPKNKRPCRLKGIALLDASQCQRHLVIGWSSLGILTAVIFCFL